MDGCVTGGAGAPVGTPTCVKVGVWGGCTNDGAGPKSLSLSIETSCKWPYCAKGWVAGGRRDKCGLVEDPGVTGVTWGGRRPDNVFRVVGLAIN